MATEFPNSYKDPLYASLDAATEQKLGLPAGLLSSIRLTGEKSNADQVSEASARTPYQFIPSTRKAVIEKYGIDPLLSPETASEAAGLLLKESLDRNKGDAAAAVGEYHGGTNRDNWGPRTKAYVNRVMVGQRATASSALENDFAKFMAANPAVPTGRSAAAVPGAPAAAAAAPGAAETPIEVGFAQFLAKQQSKPAQIPGQNGEEVPVPAAPVEPSIADRILGAGEAALALGTGMTGGMLGMARGAVGGVVQAIRDGNFGTPEANKLVEDSAMQGAAQFTYAPRTATGQEYAQAAGDALAQTIPVTPLTGELAALSRAGQLARPAGTSTASAVRSAAAPVVAPIAEATAPLRTAVAPAIAKVQDVAAAIPGRVAQVFGREAEAGAPTPGTLGSVGAAGTDMATLRRMTADELPVPINLTKGQAERTFEQLRFERETAKDPRVGAPLRERAAEQNQGILRNFDAWTDMTGAEAPDLKAVGVAVDKALVDKARRDKTEIRVAYKEAEKAGELAAPVSLSRVVDYLNEAAPDTATAPVLTAARQQAIKLGIAREEGGQLVPVVSRRGDPIMNTRPETTVPLKIAETYRQAINRVTDYEPTNVRQATIIKKLIDESTQDAGGDLYRSARRLRERYANQYENRAVIAKLLDTKRGTNDRQVAFEDVFDHAVLRGSHDDLRTVRKVLQTAGDDGKQAWRELQGQTVNYIRDQATRSVALDERGNKIISPAGLDKAIRQLDADRKLDFIFGKKGAEQMRAINDLAKYVYTTPPGAVNTSNTASVLLAALDMGISGASGMPLPITSGLRMVVNNVKDRRIQRQIREALGTTAAPAKPTSQRPPGTTVH